MSDTPRTDAVVIAMWNQNLDMSEEAVHANVARQLERELALANARIDYLCSPDSSQPEDSATWNEALEHAAQFFEKTDSPRFGWTADLREIARGIRELKRPTMNAAQGNTARDAARYRWLREQVKVWPADSWSGFQEVCLDVKFPCNPPSVSMLTDAQQFDDGLDEELSRTPQGEQKNG